MGDHLRNLLVSKDPETLQLLEVGNNIKGKYKDQSAKCSLPFLVKGLTILNKTDIQYKSSKNQRLQVELALMQLCSINSIGADTEKKNDLNKAEIKPQSPANSSTTTPVSANPPTSTGSPATPAQTNDIPTTTPIAVSTTSETKTPIAISTPTIPASINSDVSSNGTTIKKPLIKTSTPSINQHLNIEKKAEQKTDDTAEQNNNSSQPKSIFTLQELEAAWDKYANDLKVKGKTNLATSLLSRRPSLENETTINFPITNKAIEETINEDKMNFLGFLRKELNNYSILLNLVMTTDDESKTNLYTATDRFKHLAEKNPNINKLRQAYDLDIEF